MLPKMSLTAKSIWGDGAYDASSVYEALHIKRINPIIPPQRNAILSGKNYRKQRYLDKGSLVREAPLLIPRDLAIQYINLFRNKEEERKRWKQHSFYHLHSVVETAIMRFKQTFTDKLKARSFKNQQAEVRVKCVILNKTIQIAYANSCTSEFLS